MSLFTELKRRNVFRVGLTYLVVAWLLIQIANNVVTPLGLPGWTTTLVIVLLALGFPVALILAWAFELTPEGLRRETAPVDAPARTRGVGRRWDFVIIAGLVIALGYSLWGRFSTSPATSPTGEVTLAVLPFEDLSPKKNQGYFADGIAEQLLDSLARIKGLRVTARTSSFFFKGKNEDMRAIGKTLGVENLLEGSVRKDGDQVRVTAQLINAVTGYHLWSQTYDRKLADIFTVQDEMATAVANALQVSLGVGELGQMKGMTRNPQAYDEYLIAESYAHQVLGDETFLNAIAHYERAIALDPTFSIAWAQLSEAYGALPNVSRDTSRAADWSAKSVQALTRSRALSPDSPLVRAAYADHAARQGDWSTAAHEYDALANDVNGPPLDPATQRSYGEFLVYIGHPSDAVAQLVRAKAANPLDYETALALSEAYADSGDLDAAIAEQDRGMTLDAPPGLIPTSALVTALATGDRTLIAQRLALATKINISGTAVINTEMAKDLDTPSDARAVLQKLAVDPSKQSTFDLDVIAIWASYYDDPALALATLHRLPIAAARLQVTIQMWRPVFRKMRALPGFKDLVRKLDLVDFWRKSGDWGDFCHPVGDTDFECK
jgi:TolB-like protein